jgi:hypothetical protein
MPIVTIQKMQCNVCRVEAERELFSKIAPPKGWLVFRTQSGEDRREKLEVAVCPDCAAKIAELAGKAPEPESPESPPPATS